MNIAESLSVSLDVGQRVCGCSCALRSTGSIATAEIYCAAIQDLISATNKSVHSEGIHCNDPGLAI